MVFFIHREFTGWGDVTATASILRYSFVFIEEDYRRSYIVLDILFRTIFGRDHTA